LANFHSTVRERLLRFFPPTLPRLDGKNLARTASGTKRNRPGDGTAGLRDARPRCASLRRVLEVKTLCAPRPWRQKRRSTFSCTSSPSSISATHSGASSPGRGPNGHVWAGNNLWFNFHTRLQQQFGAHLSQRQLTFIRRSEFNGSRTRVHVWLVDGRPERGSSSAPSRSSSNLNFSHLVTCTYGMADSP